MGKISFFVVRATADTVIYQASILVFTNLTWYSLQRCQSHKLLLFLYIRDFLKKKQVGVTRVFFFFKLDLLHARLSRYHKAWSYREKKHKKIKVCRKSIEISNRDNVKAPIQFRRKSQPQHLNPFMPTSGIPKCLRKICAFWNQTTLIDLGVLILEQ